MFRNTRLIKVGIVSTSSTKACVAELSARASPTAHSQLLLESGLSKLLINDALQFSGLDPSKELTVQLLWKSSGLTPEPERMQSCSCFPGCRTLCQHRQDK